jgi:parallel beta-helix repeat protein
MRRYVIALVVVLALASAIGRSSPLSATGPVVVVSPGSLVVNTSPTGWYFWNDFNDTPTGSPGQLVTGPATPPLGAGSVELGPLTTASGATGHSAITTNAYFGTALADITSMSYSTYQPGPTLAIAIQFDVQYRTGDSAYGGRLVFEPYQNGTVVVGSGWQSWSPLAGKWWASHTDGSGTGGAQVVALPSGNCGISTPCTWSQILAAFPDAQIYGRFLLKAGSGWSGFDGNADSLTVGVSGSDVTYDFENNCTTDCYVRPDGSDANTGLADTPGDAKQTIQAAVTSVSAGGTIHVAAGTYDQDVTVNKANVQLLGSGIDVSTITGPIGGGSATVQVAAGGVVIDGFTITRDGNNPVDWNGALNSAGVAVQGQTNTVELRNSKLTGNRTGVDVNNSNGNSIHNNIIDNNRTGMIFRNQTDSTSVVNNFITNNWTIGVLFLDGSGGTNVPVQSAASSTFGDNDISGNWYGQVEDRQSGGSLPVPPTNPKNFEHNWWGSLPTAVSTAQATEPGYSAQIPVVFGGSATPPGNQPEIKGSASANIDYAPYQCTGTDTSVAIGFQPAGVLCSPPSPTNTVVTASSMTATGWLFYNDENDTIDPTLGSFVTGPGTPPLGTGSAQISVTGTQRRNLATYQFSGTPLADIATLRFRTYNPSAGNGGSATRSAYLNFNVDFDGSDTWQKRLYFVPSQNGTVLQDTWQEWDAINFGGALWGYSGATWPITGQPGTTLKTWSQILSDYPGIRMRVTDSFVGLRVGEPYANGYTEDIDSFTFGTNSALTIFNFEDTPQCTSVCYVNATTGNDAFDGSTVTSPKRTIQGGVNQVSPSGTVNVAAGTYIENVTIPKALTLSGAGQASTTVIPALSGPTCVGGSLCAGGSNIVLVQASDVTIHDLTLDGDNPSLTSGVVAGGADLDARNGIIENFNAGVFNNLTVHHVTVKNIYLRGMYASSGGSGFNFHDDTVQNVQADPASIAMFNFGGSGTFANNTVSGANDAISSNHSRGTSFLNNVITASASGVHTDNAGDGGGSADLLDGNSVSNCTTGGFGVWTFVPYIQPTVKRNIITNCAVGLAATGSFVPVGTLFQDNEVTGAAGSTGVYITTNLFGFGSGNASATLTGNIITGNDDGIYYESETGYTLAVDNVGNAVYGNTNTGATTSGGGAFDVKMLGDWWGTASGPANASNPGGTGNSVADGIAFSPWLGIGTDASGAPGFQMASPMTWVAGPALCDGTCIQKAVDLASPGDTINVLAGTFNEQVRDSGKSNLLINGAGMASTFVKPGGVVVNTTRINTNPAAPIFDVEDATGVNIQNLTADGSLNGISGCSPDFLGFYYKKASGSLTNVAASHIKLSPSLLGCQTGVGVFVEADSPDVANVVVTNAQITDYQKGGIVANRTGTTLAVTGNTISGIGPTTQIAQNGIQLGFGASGSVSTSNISGNDYTPSTDASTGVLLFQAASAMLNGNNVHNNQEGLFVESTNGAIVTGNQFSATRDTAIFADASSTGTYTGNTIVGQPGSTGIYVYDSSSNNTVSGNAIRLNDHGVIVDFTAGAPAGNLFHGNCIAGNFGAGVFTTGSLVGPRVDATGNWWGAVDGATPPGHGDSIIPGDASTIDASGYLVAPVAGCTLTADTDGDGLTDVSEVNTYGTDWQNPDTDGDGCGDGHEVTFPSLNANDSWDFYSVPVPALFAALNPLIVFKDNVVSGSDAQAVFAYVKVGAHTGTTAYEQDLNNNGIKDGIEYDRSVVGPGHSGPPDGVVAASDAQLAFKQSQLGYHC